jgi:hypothetical protein
MSSRHQALSRRTHFHRTSAHSEHRVQKKLWVRLADVSAEYARAMKTYWDHHLTCAGYDCHPDKPTMPPALAAPHARSAARPV